MHEDYIILLIADLIKCELHEKASNLHEKAWKPFAKCGIVFA
jgi:hypothetical protein